jgi:hypothetical protein
LSETEDRRVSRISFLEHRGRPIIVMDFSHLRPGDEFLASIAEAEAWIASQPAKSILSVFDATGAIYNLEVVAVLKDFTKHNEPFMRASAVVGIEGLLNIALTAISKFSGRTFKTFKDRPSALDWLVEQ